MSRLVDASLYSFTRYDSDSLNRLTGITNRKADNTLINADSFTYNDPAHADLRDSETITNGDGFALTAGTTTYDYNNLNQLLTHSPDKTFAYDADGNMTTFFTPEGHAATATYDAENRLKTVAYNDGTLHNYEFTYSGDGMLAKQVIDGVETRFVRDGYSVLQERDDANAVQRRYVWDRNSPGGIGGLLALYQSGWYSYLYDGKGNVSAVLDNNQAVAASYAYDAFGRLMSESGTLEQPYRFSTKYYYPGFGGIYYGYRFDLPAIGKWMTRDPIGEAGGMNLYGFVGNNSVNYVDYYGFIPRWMQNLLKNTEGWKNASNNTDKLVDRLSCNKFTSPDRALLRQMILDELSLTDASEFEKIDIDKINKWDDFNKDQQRILDDLIRDLLDDQPDSDELKKLKEELERFKKGLPCK